MTAERWQATRPALELLLELPESERTAWLDARAGTDAELVAELRELLKLRDESSGAWVLDACVPPSLVGLAVDSLSGQHVGNYVLDAQIGQGGMGTVWSAKRENGHFEGRVAVKLLDAAIRAPETVHRFLHEGRLLAKLSHPNIARILDAGVTPEGMPYLILEHVEGTPIDVHCDARSLSVNERIRLFIDVLAAVEHSHTHLVVHRDIKPTNVLVTDGGTPKLLDFGVARLIEVDSSALASKQRADTLWGGRAMTLLFAAPEQLQGNPTTTRTDVYGLGVLLYLLLTGRHPTGLDDTAASAYVTPTIEGTLLRPVAALRAGTLSQEQRHSIAAARSTTHEKLVRQLAGDLDNILLKALKTIPAERYASASEFAQDLGRFIEHRPVLARGDSLTYRARKFVRRHRLATAASAIALLAIAVSGMTALHSARAARLEAQRASSINAFVRDMFGVGKSPTTEAMGRRSTTVEELLDEGARKLQSGTQWSPEARVDLIGTLADMYVNIGQPAKALPLLEHRLELLAMPSADSPLRAQELLAETWLQISNAAGRAGFAERSNAALDRAEPLVRELRARAPGIFARWSYASSVRQLLLDPLAAAATAREAAISFDADGDTFGVVRSLCQTAFALSRAGQYSQAASVVRDAVRRARAMNPQDKDLMVYVLAIDTDLAFETLDLPGAELKSREALRMLIETKGSMHPMTARGHMRVAHALLRRGEFAACITEANAGVLAVENSSGSTDRRVLPQALQVLGLCLVPFGRADEAIAHLERATRLWDPAANGGMNLGTTYADLSRAHLMRNDLASAQAAHARMLAVMDASATKRKALEIALATSELRIAQGRSVDAVQILEPFAGAAVQQSTGWNRVDLQLVWVRALTAAADPRAGTALRDMREFIRGTPLRDHAPTLEADLLLVESVQMQATRPAVAARLRAAALAIVEPRVDPASARLAALR